MKPGISPKKSRFQQGVFKPKYPGKYQGTFPIVFRSSWERRFLEWLDMNSAVLLWASESLVIPYISPIDGKEHRYYVDFLAQMKTKEGPKNYAIEIKPKHEMLEPKMPKKVPTDAKKVARLITESNTYKVNQAKWHAAKEFCRKRGVTFLVLNEDDLGINK